MDRSPIDLELFRQLLALSYSEPLQFSREVDRRVTRNRALSSASRREIKHLLFRALRWRRRLWGDIAPTSVTLPTLESKLAEAEKMRMNPPWTKWKTLTMDSLGRELSYPTWLVDVCVHAYGLQSAVELFLALNEEAPTTLRTNTLKTTREGLCASLAQEGIRAEMGKNSPWAIHLQQRVNLRSLQSFKQGWFELQDEGSQMAVLASEAQPRTRVVDACAGAGGKSLALAAMMGNQGKIFALDADSRPLEELKKRAQRAGANIIESRWIAQDDPTPLSEVEGKADLVLVDAPCSSLGTLRRHPWLKWHYTRDAVASFPSRQLNLLRRFSRLVREGGRLQYVTCTIHPLENQAVVATFGKEEKQFREVLPPRWMQPHVEGTDGFFMAAWVK